MYKFSTSRTSSISVTAEYTSPFIGAIFIEMHSKIKIFKHMVKSEMYKKKKNLALKLKFIISKFCYFLNIHFLNITYLMIRSKHVIKITQLLNFSKFYILNYNAIILLFYICAADKFLIFLSINDWIFFEGVNS